MFCYKKGKIKIPVTVQILMDLSVYNVGGLPVFFKQQ